MKQIRSLSTAGALVISLVTIPMHARQVQEQQRFFVGNSLGLPVHPAADNGLVFVPLE